ncbi:MAG: DUF3783 domain-containing protein [Spirochaetaceae bacterium]|nr:DUF3783 domain-containing protein [Spirochaetaceae bacterium]
MSFKKMEEDGSLPGPRAILLSGFSQEVHRKMVDYTRAKNLNDIDVIPCREDSLNVKVSDVLSGKSSGGIIPAEKLPPVMLWSGLTHTEFDTALSGFHETGIPRPIFATTTKHNLDFTVKELLQHLLSEQKSLRTAMKEN